MLSEVATGPIGLAPGKTATASMLPADSVDLVHADEIIGIIAQRFANAFNREIASGPRTVFLRFKIFALK